MARISKSTQASAGIDKRWISYYISFICLRNLPLLRDMLIFCLHFDADLYIYAV